MENIMANTLKQEYENLVRLEKELTGLAKNEFLDFIKDCNGFMKSEDLKDEFEINIKLLKNLKDIDADK